MIHSRFGFRKASTVDDTHHDVRINKKYGGNDNDYRGVHLKFLQEIRGDFDIRIDLHSASLDLVDGKGGNSAGLYVGFGDHGFGVGLTDEMRGRKYSVWATSHPKSYAAVKATSATSGTMRITREGNRVTGYVNDIALFSNFYGDSPVKMLALPLGSNLSKDAIAVTFDNFYLSCDEMVPLK